MQNVHLAAGNSNCLIIEIFEPHDPLKEDIFKEPLTVVKVTCFCPTNPVLVWNWHLTWKRSFRLFRATL